MTAMRKYSFLVAVRGSAYNILMLADRIFRLASIADQKNHPVFRVYYYTIRRGPRLFDPRPNHRAFVLGVYGVRGGK